MKHPSRILAGALAVVLLFAGGCEVTVTAEVTPTPESTADPTVIVLDDAGVNGFGMLADSYKAYGNPVNITVSNVTGDIDKLGSVSLRASYEGVYYSVAQHQFEFVFEPQLPVVFTAHHYVNGEEISGDTGGVDTMHADGYVEVYRGEDTWRWHSRAKINTPTPKKAAYFTNDYYYIGLTDLPDENDSQLPTLGKNNELRVFLPIDEPGIYRYTLYFRESIDHTAANVTTGDELYSITFDVTIPKTENRYDVLAVEGYYYEVPDDNWWEVEHVGETAYDFVMLIRNNDEEDDMCFNTTKTGKLEMRSGGDWVEIDDSLHHQPQYNGRDNLFFTERRLGDSCIVAIVTIYPQQLPGEYRFTPAFVTEYGKEYKGVTFYFTLDK